MSMGSSCLLSCVINVCHDVGCDGRSVYDLGASPTASCGASMSSQSDPNLKSSSPQHSIFLHPRRQSLASQTIRKRQSHPHLLGQSKSYNNHALPHHYRLPRRHSAPPHSPNNIPPALAQHHLTQRLHPISSRRRRRTTLPNALPLGIPHHELPLPLLGPNPPPRPKRLLHAPPPTPRHLPSSHPSPILHARHQHHKLHYCRPPAKLNMHPPTPAPSSRHADHSRCRTHLRRVPGLAGGGAAGVVGYLREGVQFEHGRLRTGEWDEGGAGEGLGGGWRAGGRGEYGVQ